MCPTLVRPCQRLRSLQRLGFLVGDTRYNATHVPVLPIGVSACNPSCQAVPCRMFYVCYDTETQTVSTFTQWPDTSADAATNHLERAPVLCLPQCDVRDATKASLAAPLQGGTAALPRSEPVRRRTKQEGQQRRERAGGGVGQWSGEPPAPAR